MSDDFDFDALVNDTDAFMKERGYLSTRETAKKWGVTSARIRQLIQDGHIEDVRIGSKRYIKEGPYPVRRRKKEDESHG